MENILDNCELAKALKTISDFGFSITKIHESGLYIIRSPHSGTSAVNGYKYSFRMSWFTKWDLTNRWPEGTEIARIDQLSIPWEPIIPTNKNDSVSE